MPASHLFNLKQEDHHMTIKKVESIIAPPAPHMVGDGFRVHNFIPHLEELSRERMNPFILMDYNAKIEFSPRKDPRGVGVHPHRGFETVTIVYKGKVAHHDSRGNSGVIGPGDIQWMTAASGVLHKEYHEENFSQQGGEFHIVQLWINLPAKDKKTESNYQTIVNNQIPKVELPDNAGLIEVIAGNYQETKGIASTFSPMHLFNAKLNKGGSAEFSFPANYNTAILVVEGSVKINNNDLVPTDYFALFENKGETFTLQAVNKATVLVLSGEPIPEPIAAYGPFVMNNVAELKQAYLDLAAGLFGKLKD